MGIKAAPHRNLEFLMFGMSRECKSIYIEVATWDLKFEAGIYCSPGAF